MALTVPDVALVDPADDHIRSDDLDVDGGNSSAELGAHRLSGCHRGCVTRIARRSDDALA
jgi:hypothetical protein